ncbi:MAG: phenylalanine--tRNA ligase subunit beta [Bdellovibrionaceae bacterium]|nr:phenylalanine--tRNA ligase subunit beta [Pseudobdellovibrionaceae bacterium]
MKISLQWINDFVDVSDYLNKATELADKITAAGLEVEEIIDRRKDFDMVVTGLILEKAQHPNADRLSLCRVTTGEGVVHQIVCGAQNHKTGDRVVVALPGAVLPGNFAIKQSSIRGVESGGMLCSLKELGLATESDGIEILPENAPIGQGFAEYMGLNDVVFELKVTPNRADCLSHFGLAREIACLLGRELKNPAAEFLVAASSTKQSIALSVKEPELCPRYVGRFIGNVQVGPSPGWLKKRLETVGLNSINNVVDVTNYVMMELGQPLHAFDAGKIAGRQILVERARPQEKFVTLDGTEVTLSGEELVIRDGERAVALAGVVGGKNSGVSEETREIFLESANFQPMSVRKTSRRLGIETDSAYRFSRGVDPDGALRAADRATELLLKVAGGEAFGDIHDTNPQPVRKQFIEIRLNDISERLGYAAEESRFLDYMKRLTCQVETLTEGAYRVLPPSFRFDLEMDVDLVEEYARLTGYEHIPEALPVFAQAPAAHDEKYRLLQKWHRLFRGRGFLQAVNPGFTASAREKAFLGGQRGLPAAGLALSEEPIRLKNPLSDDLDVMRSSLSESLYRNLLTNVKYGNEEGALYEIGSTFSRAEGGAYVEKTRLGLMAWGRPRGLWTKTLQHPVVFDLKAVVENLLESLRISSYTWVTPPDRGEVPGFCHRGQYAQLLVEGKKVGFIGTLHPVLLEEEKIRVPAAVAEFDVEALLKGQPRPYRADSLSKFPAVERDFAFVMPKNVKIGEVLKDIRKAAGGLLVEAEVFDVYEGDKVEAGKKSVAVRLVYQDKNATLQEAQIQELQSKILESVSKTFGIVVR